jgi:hypothetical protein
MKFMKHFKGGAGYRSLETSAISSFLYCQTFQMSFKSTTSTRYSMQAGVVQGRLISPLLFSLFVKDMPIPSCHIELALYA